MEENRNSDLERLYFCAMPQISLNMDLGFPTWARLAQPGFPALLPQEKILFLAMCNKSFINHACSVKMVAYLPVFYRSICSQKTYLVNIHPSWPHAWCITHIYLS